MTTPAERLLAAANLLDMWAIKAETAAPTDIHIKPALTRGLSDLMRAISMGVNDHYDHINPKWADSFRDEIVAGMVHGYTEALALADWLLAGAE
jgi:hypothetical protein